MDIGELKNNYKRNKKIIKKRLKEFSAVRGDAIFYELCFCLLTPQSNAHKCWDCVGILKNKDFINKKLSLTELKKILRDKTRFYKNKSNYLKLSKDQYNNIKKIIINKNKKDIIKNKKIREFLVKNIKGLGYKEASHFLRNIGYKNLAILDRHILKNLQKFKVINKVPKHLNKKNYLSIEEKFYKFSKKIDIPMDELDLLFWSMETGKVFK